MKPIKIRWWLLHGLLVAQYGAAQSLDISPAVLCLRAHCGRLEEARGLSVVRIAPATPSHKSSPERDWQEHTGTRAHTEDYNCLLSLGFGGELRSGGYKGVRLFGQTRTLNLSAPKSRAAVN